MNECLHQQAPVVYSLSLAAQAAQPAICDRLSHIPLLCHLGLLVLNGDMEFSMGSHSTGVESSLVVIIEFVAELLKTFIRPDG